VQDLRRLSLYAVALGLVALAVFQGIEPRGTAAVSIGITTKVLTAWLAVIIARYVQDTTPPRRLLSWSSSRRFCSRQRETWPAGRRSRSASPAWRSA
jgi:hypothetical protein